MPSIDPPHGFSVYVAAHSIPVALSEGGESCVYVRRLCGQIQVSAELWVDGCQDRALFTLPRLTPDVALALAEALYNCATGRGVADAILGASPGIEPPV